MSYYPHEVPVRPDELVGQWVLTSVDTAVPAGWPSATHGRWTVACSRPLECLPVRDTTGRTIGWLIGHAVTEAGVFLRPESVPVLLPDADAGVFVDGLNGRFVFVDIRAPEPMVYPDGLATLACVFSGAERAVASTSGLIPRSSQSPFLIERILGVDAPYSPGMYPLGLTPREAVYRVLPNHVLDCASWTLVRRWPRGPITRSPDPEKLIRVASDGIRRTLAGVSAHHPLHMTLTGGHDSRLMLACARDLMPTTTLFTADLGDRSSWLDVTIATRIASRLGLAHRVIRDRARPRDLRAWVARTGGETGEPRGWRGTRALAFQPEGRATITGTVADMAKLVGWRKRALERPVTPESMLRRCAVGNRPEFLARAEAWLDSLPDLDQVALADVFHTEQVKGCWAGVIEYGELGLSSARLCPMTRRDLIDGAVRLPLEYRLGGGLHHNLLERLWPELLDFPFNDGQAIPAARARVYAFQEGMSTRIAPYRRAWRRGWARLKGSRPGT